MKTKKGKIRKKGEKQRGEKRVCLIIKALELL